MLEFIKSIPKKTAEGLIVGGLITIIGIIALWMYSFVAPDVRPNDIGANVIKGVEGIENCIFKESEWETGFGVLERREDNLFVLASTTQRNGLLRYKKSVESDSEITFTFTPLSESSINVVITIHELYEIIIGDGDNIRRVTTKANLHEGSPMVLISANQEDAKNFFLPNSFVVGKEVTVRIIQKPLVNNEFELILTVFPEPGSEGITKNYQFPIPTEFEGTEKPLRISVGVIKTQNTEDVLTRLRCFKVSSGEKLPIVTYSK